MPETTTEPIRVDLNTPEITAALQAAPIYRKHSEVQIEEVKPGTLVETILADGTAETSLASTEERCIKVTNPGGETYLIERAKRDSRYDHVAGNTWQAKGCVRAIRNLYDRDVVIDAPWGEDQFGGGDVVFAATIEDEHGGIGENRYLIGGAEFADTYRAESQSTCPMSPPPCSPTGCSSNAEHRANRIAQGY